MEASSAHAKNTSLLADQDIVTRISAGETGLFEILMRRYNQRLFRIIRGYLRDDEEVRDAMQNTYLKAFDKLHQFQGNASFSTWLIRIGINEALIRLKELKKGRAVFLHTDVPISFEAVDKQMNPETTIMQRETKFLLEKAIDNLPSKYRIVYVLKEIEGVSNEEACSMLDLTDANLRVRLHRAKAILKENLFNLSSVTGIFEFRNKRCDELVFLVMQKIERRD